MPPLVRFLSGIMDMKDPGDCENSPGAWPHLDKRCDTWSLRLPRGSARSTAAERRSARVTPSVAAGNTPISLSPVLSALLTGAARYSARTTPPASARRTSGRRIAGLSRSAISRAVFTRTARALTAEPSSRPRAPLSSAVPIAGLSAGATFAASRSGTSALFPAVMPSSARATPPGAAIPTSSPFPGTSAPLTGATERLRKDNGTGYCEASPERDGPGSCPHSARAPGCDRNAPR